MACRRYITSSTWQSQVQGVLCSYIHIRIIQGNYSESLSLSFAEVLKLTLEVTGQIFMASLTQALQKQLPPVISSLADKLQQLALPLFLWCESLPQQVQLVGGEHPFHLTDGLGHPLQIHQSLNFRGIGGNDLPSHRASTSLYDAHAPGLVYDRSLEAEFSWGSGQRQAKRLGHCGG